MSEGREFAPRVAIGVCGSGKTYCMQRLVASTLRRGPGYRFLILDVNREWPGKPAEGAPVIRGRAYVRTAAAAAVQLDRGRHLVIVHPRREDLDDDELPNRSIAEALAGAAIARPSTILVIPEIHRAIGNPGKVSPNIRELLHQYRHNRAGVWLDTQHFRDCHTEIRDAARWVYLHATASPRDLRRIAEYGGPALVDAVRAANGYYTQGIAGYHVRVNGWNPSPPYEVRR